MPEYVSGFVKAGGCRDLYLHRQFAEVVECPWTSAEESIIDPLMIWGNYQKLIKDHPHYPMAKIVADIMERDVANPALKQVCDYPSLQISDVRDVIQDRLDNRFKYTAEVCETFAKHPDKVAAAVLAAKQVALIMAEHIVRNDRQGGDALHQEYLGYTKREFLATAFGRAVASVFYLDNRDLFVPPREPVTARLFLSPSRARDFYAESPVGYISL